MIGGPSRIASHRFEFATPPAEKAATTSHIDDGQRQRIEHNHGTRHQNQSLIHTAAPHLRTCLLKPFKPSPQLKHPPCNIAKLSYCPLVEGGSTKTIILCTRNIKKSTSLSRASATAATHLCSLLQPFEPSPWLEHQPFNIAKQSYCPLIEWGTTESVILCIRNIKNCNVYIASIIFSSAAPP